MSFSLLPQDYLFEIIKGWLSLVDMLQFDGALCSKKWRKSCYLDLVEKDYFTLVWCKGNRNFVKWIKLRRIKLGDFSVDISALRSIQELKQLSYSKLMSVEMTDERISLSISKADIRVFKMLLLSAKSLRTISLHGNSCLFVNILSKPENLSLGYLQNITSLQLSLPFGVSLRSETLKAIPKLCNKLNVLSISVSEDTFRYFAPISTANPNLTDLTLIYHNAPSDILTLIAKLCLNLTKLHVSKLQNIDFTIIKEFISEVKYLRFLTIDNNDFNDRQFVWYDCINNSKVITVQIPRRKDYNIVLCDFFKSIHGFNAIHLRHMNITDVLLQTIAHNHSQITELSLGYCEFTATGISKLFTGCDIITKFHLSGTQHSVDSTLLAPLFALLKHLKTLQLGHIVTGSTEDYVEIAKSVPSLAEFHIQSWQKSIETELQKLLNDNHLSHIKLSFGKIIRPHCHKYILA